MENMTNWYTTLNKPTWAPPTQAFGIAWGIIYPIIVVSFGYVAWQWWKGNLPFAVLLPFILNLVFNLSFTYFQFGLQSQNLAFLDIILVLLTLIWAVVAVWSHTRWVAWAQLPYLAWGSFATALQAYIWWNN